MNDSNQTALTTCSRCKVAKPATEFYKHRNGISVHCKLCNHASRIAKTRENRRKAIELLGGQCFKCGYKKCLAAMHFHHPDPDLKESVKDFRYLRNRSWETIKASLLAQRCILLCANCHAEEHWNE